MTETVKIISPIDGRVYAERPVATQAEIQAAVSKAKRARAVWSQVTIRERAKYLTHFIDALIGMNDRVVEELAWQIGRPSRWGGEKGNAEERTRYMISIAEEALKPVIKPPLPGISHYITREPVGTVLVIAPWNYPYLTTVNSVVPGLMAGNAVILKHATQTLLVGERFDEAMKMAGLPDGLFQNLVLSHADTEALIASGAMDHISFTGSVEGGRRMECAAAGTFATMGLELGGKDPAYVREDVNLAHAVENLAEGVFFNSGQSCCGVERIYVHHSVYDNFVDGFVEASRNWKLGNPLEADTWIGPMANGRFADVVRAQTEEALRQGAKTHLQTQHPLDKPGSPYLAAQVLTNVNHQMSVMREESFGPVVGIMKVADDDEAITLMNDSPYGLTASVWTSDLDAAARIGARVETGTILANRCDYLDPALVWTGVKDTGKGGALSDLGYTNLTQPKSYHLRKV